MAAIAVPMARRMPWEEEPPMPALEERFGTMVFGDAAQKRYLPKDVYKKLHATVNEGKPLDLDLANAVAHAMKAWAIERGATHYAHWFQPLSCITSEKHEAFLEPMGDGTRHLPVQGQGARPGRAGCVELPQRRAARHVRGARLHRLGSHVARLHQGRGALHPHGVLLLYR